MSGKCRARKSRAGTCRRGGNVGTPSLDATARHDATQMGGGVTNLRRRFAYEYGTTSPIRIRKLFFSEYYIVQTSVCLCLYWCTTFDIR